MLLPRVVAVPGGVPDDVTLTRRSFLDSEAATEPGLGEDDGALLLPHPPTLAPSLPPPRLDLLPRLRGLHGPTEDATVVNDRSCRVDENPFNGDNGAIELDGIVDRRFFPSRTNTPPFFVVGIVLVLSSSKLT